MQIKLEHICCNTKILPIDFFNESIFGKSMIHNESGTTERSSSDLNIEYFKHVGFPKNFCTIIEHGLPLLLGANPPRRLVPNHASANLSENKDFIVSTLTKWENMNILSYVYEQPHIVNPLSVVTNGTKKRFVLDARSSGLNDHIISPKFHLPNMEGIAQLLQRDDFMLKLDLANGFLQLPIRNIEKTYLGFRSPIDGRFGVLNRLPFGLRSAPFLFATFTNAIKQATTQILKIQTEVYIDDWFMANRQLTNLQADYTRFEEFLSNLGVSIQHEKTEGPARCITYLGLTIDTSMCQIRLPEMKRLKYLAGIEDLVIASQPTMAQLAKTAGRLVHIASVHRAGAAHIQPLWDILYKDRKQWTRVQLEHEGLNIDPELRECLSWWKQTLSVPNIQRKIWVSPSNSLFLWSKLSANELVGNAFTICTDASNQGWGASTGTYTSTGMWSNKQRRNSINWRELKAVNLALNSWDFIYNGPVLLLTDSSTVVAALRKRASHTKALQDLIKELASMEESRNIEVVALHIPGVLNDLPDRLSRGMDVTQASLLTFERSSAPVILKNISQLIGLVWNDRNSKANPFYRHANILVTPQSFLIAVTTPDIPFLKRQLYNLINHEYTIFILIPKLPTSEIPLPFTQIVYEISDVSCLNAIEIKWSVLRVVTNGGIPARTAIQD